MENERKFFSHVTSGQIADGLDTFYKDYRNRSIGVGDAVWLVVRAIAGAPQDELDMDIQDFRKEASSD